MITRVQIGLADQAYPRLLRERMGEASPCVISARGNISLLSRRPMGLVCSVQCPGSIIIKTLDAARALREAGAAVIGGFHAPMEREFLDILLRGDQPVVMCAARGLSGLRLGKAVREALEDGRLLVISPFDDHVRRTTAVHAVERNNLVAALSSLLLVPHAAPGSKTQTTAEAALARGQRVCTFEDQENMALVQQGVRAVNQKQLIDLAIA